MSVAARARRAELLDLLARDGFATVAAICRSLQVSPATVRRDLEDLRLAGQVQRTHGGAVLSGERPFKAKVTEMAEAKWRIADVAAGLIRPGMVIGFTGGTTTQSVARRVAGTVEPLTVVTNAITAAMEFASSRARIIVTGGELRNETFELVGPLAEPTVAHIHIDLFFAGVDGLSVAGGLTTHNPLEARISRMLIDRSSQVVVVADHTKLGRRTLAHIAPLAAVGRLITDREVKSEALEEIVATGIAVDRA